MDSIERFFTSRRHILSKSIWFGCFNGGFTVLSHMFLRLSMIVLLTGIAVTSGNRAQADDAAPDNDTYIEVEELKSVLRTRNVDAIVETLNEVKQMHYKHDILVFLDGLWRGDRETHADLPWDVVSLDIVRLEIGDVLVQAHRNGLYEPDVDQIHQFARERMSSRDVRLAMDAILTVSLFDSAADVPEIASIALPEEKTFNAAIIALTSMCNDAAKQALADLEPRMTNASHREFLIETRRQTEDYKARNALCSGG